ncbi:MAG TPA: tail fiber domain-containing protein, partial [Candidatus Paceibacterota bacterium]|nr:tail fiber domain-containing protein [Candidatus Paceibacterota bacterium]
NSTNPTTEELTLLSTGYVGINKPMPAYGLDVTSDRGAGVGFHAVAQFARSTDTIYGDGIFTGYYTPDGTAMYGAIENNAASGSTGLVIGTATKPAALTMLNNGDSTFNGTLTAGRTGAVNALTLYGDALASNYNDYLTFNFDGSDGYYIGTTNGIYTLGQLYGGTYIPLLKMSSASIEAQTVLLGKFSSDGYDATIWTGTNSALIGSTARSLMFTADAQNGDTNGGLGYSFSSVKGFINSGGVAAPIGALSINVANGTPGTLGEIARFLPGGFIVNGTSLDASAITEFDSTTKGVLLPRMNGTQMNAISSPAAGLEVYNTTDNAIEYYNGTSWVSGGGGGSITLKTNGTNNGSQTTLNLIAGSGVTLTDNGTGGITIAASGGGSSQWSNGASSAIYYNTGNVGVGTSTPGANLVVNSPSTISSGDLFDVNNNGSSRLTLDYAGNLFVQGNITCGGSCGGGGSSQWTTSGSDIYFTGGKVGIGTSSTPAAALEVDGANYNSMIINAPSYVDLALAHGGTAFGYLGTGQILADSYSGQGGGQNDLGLASTGGIQFSIGGTTLPSMTIASGGIYVPATLYLNRNAAAIQFDSSVGNGMVFSISGTSYATLGSSGSLSLSGGSATDLAIQTMSGSNLQFATGGQATSNIRMTILSGGNIGIHNTSPGHFLDVGSSATTTGTTVAEFINAGGTCDVTPSTTGGISCTSDMTLKKNVVNLADGSVWSFNSNIAVQNLSVLNDVLALNPVNYNWNVETDGTQKHAGFIAQEVQQVFPDLVSQDPATHLLSLNYTGLLPYTVEAIKELDVQITSIDDMSSNNPFRDAITKWLADASNGIQNIFTKKVTTDQLCITDANGQTCLNRSQVDQILQQQNVQSAPSASSGDDTATQSPDVTSQSPDVSDPTISSPDANSQSPEGTDSTNSPQATQSPQ